MSNPSYRNNRKCFYSEKTTDTLCIGTVIQVLKSDQNSFDHNFVNATVPNNGGSTKYNTDIGDANVETNVEYQYPGYIYCDGSEYNISDYPALYSVIGNLYGGTPGLGITKENVFSNWPGNLGTFKVPDFKAKRLVGNSPVYGSGTVSVGESDLGVGPQTISGKWYLDKEAQKGNFTLGKVTTTGYEKVVDSIPAQIIGSQTVTINLEETRLKGPPQHTHNLLHSEAPQDAASPRKSSGDGYLRGYKNTTGRILPFTVPNGLALTHRHVLAKKPQPDSTVATYDLYNFSAGDSSSGSIKEPGFYFASGKPGFGTIVEVTTIAPPTFKKLLNASVIGERTIVTEGFPIFTYSSNSTYTTSGSFSMPAVWDEVRITVRGCAGSGGAGSTAGNAGGSSTATITSGFLSVTATGGGGGGGSTGGSGGEAGNSGSGSASGTLVNPTALAEGNSVVTSSAGLAATAGTGTTTYVANITGWTPSNTPAKPSTIAGGKGGGITGSFGSDGTHIFTLSQPSAGPFSYTSSGSATVSFSNGKLRSLTWSLAGAQGANTTNVSGGNGKALTASFTDSRLVSTTSGTVFTVSIGFQGSKPTAGGGGGSGGPGGIGGSPSGSGEFGGGGGGASAIRIGSTVIFGAGGGGGAGGKAGGGLDGQTGSGGSLQAFGGTIGGGQGANGGNGGCNGAGGGGGGGGIDSTASAAAGGSGGIAGANNTSAGGGGGGRSAYRTDYFNSPSSNSNSKTGGGSASLSYQSEESFYSPGGGGGGGGGQVITTILKTAATAVEAASFSSISFTVGSGGPGVSNGGFTTSSGQGGAVIIRTGAITSYVGGSTSISVGDIIKSASPGVEIFSTGTGSGASGGFRLPTHQVPVIEFVPISGGSGATATATVSNSVVSGVTLNTGGTGYTLSASPRFLHGAGSGTTAILTTTATGVINSMTLSPGSSTVYSRYVKFSGSELIRYIILVAQDCTDVRRITLKVARGNGVNGGNRPEPGDDLKIYYNTDGTNVFPGSKFLDLIVQAPTDQEITDNYDGSGTGNEATKWYSYSVDLPEAAQMDGVQFKIAQERSIASAANDNANQNSDQYGICDFVYEKKVITGPQFIPADGKLSTTDDILSYTVAGDPKSLYPSGISANDISFTLTSAVPLVPLASIDPDINIPLIEPYFLVKHLIKAF